MRKRYTKEQRYNLLSVIESVNNKGVKHREAQNNGKMKNIKYILQKHD